MWLQIAIAIAMMIASAAISASLAPKPRPVLAGQLDVPTAQEGDPIPVIFGTVLIKESNVIWYGDQTTQEIHASGSKK